MIEFLLYHAKIGRNSPITDVNVEDEDERFAVAAGTGLGAELHGSRPSS